MARQVNINGALTPPAEARISVFDRGFLYGDSVYEVLRTYNRKPFALAEHQARLERSAAELELPLPDRAWLEREIHRTLEAAGNEESYCRIIVTRGSGPISLDPSLARDPVTVILVQPYAPFPERLYTAGLRVHIPRIRRNLRAAVDPAIKSGNYLNSILALAEARRAGFDDALMLDVEGRVTEASAANVFVLRDGVLCTPRLETGILEGVTRGLVLRLVREHDLPSAECDLYPRDLEAAEEVLLTSTLREAMSVVQIDDRTVGSGQPGPACSRVRGWLREHALASVREE